MGSESLYVLPAASYNIHLGSAGRTQVEVWDESQVGAWGPCGSQKYFEKVFLRIDGPKQIKDTFSALATSLPRALAELEAR